MPARKKTFSRAPSQRRSHFMVEFISQVQIIDCGLNKLDSKRISLERTDVVEIFIYHNYGFRKHKVLRKMIIINNSNNNKKSLIPLSSQLIWITMWLQLYNYKNYILLINKGWVTIDLTLKLQIQIKIYRLVYIYIYIHIYICVYIYIYIYIYITNYRQYCFGLLGLISIVLEPGWR